MSLTLDIPVEMKRGGYITLKVTGDIYKEWDEYSYGGRCNERYEADIEKIEWPSGGKVAEKNIKDDLLEEKFINAANSSRERD